MTTPPSCIAPAVEKRGRVHVLSKRSESRANLFGEELRLFPGRKVPALGELVEVNELGVRPFRPASWSRIEFVGKNAHGGRDNDASDAEERITLVFPIETSPRERRIRQPSERDVVALQTF